MPNHAASVFNQLRMKAEERGKEIGTFIQRGTTFQNKHAKVQIQPDAIMYQMTIHTRTGEEEYMGRFELSNRGQTTNLIKLLAKSHKSATVAIQREP